MNSLNNTITETYCSFEVSKLLKEKGFGVPFKEYYRVTGSGTYTNGYPINHNDDTKYKTGGGMTYITAPTHALAIEWIRVNFDIHVFGNMFSITTRKYSWEIWNNTTEKHYSENNDSDQWRFSSPQEATEEALLYVLKNLI